MLAQHSAVNDFASDFAGGRRQDAQFDQTIAQQDAVAAPDVASHALVGRADSVAGAFLLPDGNRETLPSDQSHGLLALQLAGADFRSLKIGQNSDGPG